MGLVVWLACAALCGKMSVHVFVVLLFCHMLGFEFDFFIMNKRKSKPD
jgi:hypothetical protein